MTVEVLEVLRTSWSAMPGWVDAKMLCEAATLGFFGFLRSGELTVPSTGGSTRGPPTLARHDHRHHGEPDHGESSTESVQD